MGQRRRADPTLSCTSARRGLSIDEVAARVSFTVETTVLPSFALPRGACSGVSVSAGSWVLAPRHWSLDSRLFFGKIMDSKIIFGRNGALPRGACSGVSMSAGIVVRFGSHRQPLQTRAAARFVSWEGSSSTHGAFFNHELLELSRMGLRRYCLTRSGRPCSSLR